MPNRLGALARDFLPPIAYRGLRSLAEPLRRAHPPTRLHVAEIDRTLRHRGSAADRAVLHMIFSEREYDLDALPIRGAEIRAFYAACARPLIVDCGANIGAAAVWFAAGYPRSMVVAIEPDADNLRLLRENGEGLDLKIVPGAIAAESGEVELRDPGEGEWGYRTHGGGVPMAKVRAWTVPELLALAPEHTPFVLKIDIEGAEDGLFDQTPEVFARFPVVVVELHDWLLPRGGTSRSFLRWHLDHDRDLLQRGENLYSIDNALRHV